jgi:hypothetical protein
MTVKSTFFVYNVENNMQPLYFCTDQELPNMNICPKSARLDVILLTHVIVIV